MRITNNMVSRSSVASIQRALRQVDDAQRRVSSGLQVERPSDDPTAANSIMATGASIRAIDQYKRNINSARARVEREETVVGSLTQFLERAKEIGMQQGSGISDPQTRLIGKAEVDQLLQSAVQLGNTQHEGEFLFGGDQSQTAPFTTTTPPFTAVPPTGNRTTEIGSALYLKTNHNGTEVFLTTGALQALSDLSVALGANSQSGIQSALSALDTAHASLQVVTGETGAAAQQLDVASANLDALDTSLRAFKSKLQDTDIEKAMTDLVSRQTVYQSAMLATSRVLSLSLADYLR